MKYYKLMIQFDITFYYNCFFYIFMILKVFFIFGILHVIKFHHQWPRVSLVFHRTNGKGSGCTKGMQGLTFGPSYSTSTNEYS